MALKKRTGVSRGKNIFAFRNLPPAPWEKPGMSDENTFFIKAKDICHRDLITCSADDSVTSAAVIMRDRGISSIIAVEKDGTTAGLMSDHDLRSKVVASGVNPDTIKVRDVMSSPVFSVHEDQTLFEVLYQMSHNRISRVGVVDDESKLYGLIREADVVRLQTRSPQKLLRGIDNATTVEELKVIHSDTEQLITFLSLTGVRTKDLVRLISLLNDQIALRLIELLKQTRFPDLPDGFCFLVLGSEGRREQTLKTDQDNAILYSDDLSGEEVSRIEEFSVALIDALIEIGVPECPGGIMAKNEFWRRSLSKWKSAIDSWIDEPSGDSILNFSMFSDMRTLWGDESLEAELRDYIVQVANENALFLVRMAANVCTFVPPIGFFGKIKTNKQGEHAGEIDLKKAGIFALTEGIKTLALEAKVLGGSTHDKMLMLEERGILKKKQVEDVEAAFNLLCFFRLRGQVAALEEGNKPDNFISPDVLNQVEKARLLVALEVVQAFESTLRSHFQLNLLRN